MKYRIFIALPVPTSLKKEVVRWQKDHKDLPVRWIKGKNLHITIVPPWYTEDIPNVQNALRETKKPKRISLTFTTIAPGPKKHHPRLIWITGVRSVALEKLQKQLERTLNLKGEKRQLVPHITIARLPSTNSLTTSGRLYLVNRNLLDRPNKLHSKFQKEKVQWKCTVKAFTLMKSHLRRSGAEYRTIQTYPLL